MTRRLLLAVALLGCAIGPIAPAAQAQCALCAAPAATENSNLVPLTVQAESDIDFSKVGLVVANQGGQIEIASDSGARTISGALVDLGGMAVRGTVVVRGEPRRRIEVELPASVTLASADGGTLQMTDFTTDLDKTPRLGVDGVLRFGFGARLKVDGRSDGDFRGSVPITVDYK